MGRMKFVARVRADFLVAALALGVLTIVVLVAVVPRVAMGGETPSSAISAEQLSSATAAKPASSASFDLEREPTLFLVGYAHLDTQWRWEYPQVIREFLPRTMKDNFDFFEKYPHYV